MIALKPITAKLDTFFKVASYPENFRVATTPPGYDALLARFALPEFINISYNGLFLNNTPEIDRVYLVVFPNRDVIDQIIAREVERGAPGALIFTHHAADYPESQYPSAVYITEPQLEELREHRIACYVCHAPLDCNPELSTSGAIADALKLKVLGRFATYHGGQSGVYGKWGGSGFDELTKKLMETHDLPTLRYGNIRHNGQIVHKVAIVAGFGGTPEFIQEAAALGCDTFITGEWFPFGPGDWRAEYREKMRALLPTIPLNLIATSHYASEMIVLRDGMKAWFREHAPGVEIVLMTQKDPWR